MSGIYCIMSMDLLPNSITGEYPESFVLLGGASTVFKGFMELHASSKSDAFFSILTEKSHTLIKTHMVLRLVEFIILL